MATYREKYNKKYGFKKNESHSISDIAKTTGYKLSGLKKIYQKGEGAFFSNSQSVRPSVKSPQQWAYGRVYSAVMGGKSQAIDKHLLIK